MLFKSRTDWLLHNGYTQDDMAGKELSYQYWLYFANGGNGAGVCRKQSQWDSLPEPTDKRMDERQGQHKAKTNR